MPSRQKLAAVFHLIAAARLQLERFLLAGPSQIAIAMSYSFPLKTSNKPPGKCIALKKLLRLAGIKLSN